MSNPSTPNHNPTLDLVGVSVTSLYGDALIKHLLALPLRAEEVQALLIPKLSKAGFFSTRKSPDGKWIERIEYVIEPIKQPRKSSKRNKTESKA